MKIRLLVSSIVVLFVAVGALAQTTFNYTGGMQTYTVPAGVTSIQIECWGAQGGDSESCTAGPNPQEDGGLGGFAIGNLSVVPGEVLNIYVGGKPNNGDLGGGNELGGFNGGGSGGQWAGAGGGASDVRQFGNALINRVIVAGGGGGGNTGCPDHGTGGSGGGLNGVSGASPYFVPGGGGSQVVGGAAGSSGLNGALGFGGHYLASSEYHVAGGGGGYYGGGSAYAAGAGGGSSYIGGVTSGSTTAGIRVGHGQIIITPLVVCTPSSITPNSSTLSNATGECSVTPITPTAIDNCGNTINGVPNVSFPITTQGTTVVTWTYTSGSVSITQTQNVIVNDVTAPVIASCPTNVSVNNSPGVCGAVVNFTNPTATDNCSTAPVIPGYTVYGTFGGSTYYLSNSTLPASDQYNQQTLASGFAANTLSINSPAENTYVLGIRNSLGELVIPFNDVTAEGIFVWANGSPITYTNWNGGEPNNAGNEDFVQMIPGSGLWNDLGDFLGYYILEWVNGTVVAAQTTGLPSGSTFPIGTTVNTFVATDAVGNSSNCTFNVVVVDNEAPTATCQNAIVQLNGSGNVMLNTSDINNGSSDNCAIASLSLSQTAFNCSNIGVNSVTLTVTDAAGNIATCNANVTVQDVASPVVTCLSDIIVNNVPDNCGRVVNYTVPVATDNCNVTVSQTDGSGLSAGDLFPVGTTPQQYTYTDQGGNSISCSFNIIVNDVQDPEITPLTFSNITVNNTPGLCGANVPWLEPTASDNCPGVILTASNTMGSFFPVGTTTVTYTATDASSNTASLSFTVTVNDNEAPVITNCPGSISINTDATFCFATVASLGSPTFTDNCAVISTSNDAPATFPVGTTSVTWTVLDAAGNSATCTQNVVVTDNQFPVASCNDISVDLDALGSATITGLSVDGGSSDECGLQPLALSQTTFDCSHVGANTVVLTVTDVNGNVSTCSADVTINDVTAPNAVCQDVTVNLDAAGNGSITTGDIDNGSSDACGIASMTLSQTTFTCTDITTNPNSVTLSVTDVNGNSSTCSANITVVDAIAPVALCQNPTIYLDATGTATLSVNDIDNGSSDACGIATSSIDVTSFTCANVGVNNITLTITDNNGNTSTCPSIVTVVDDVNPVALCQDVTVNLDATGNGSTTVVAVNNGSSDACGIATISLSQTNFTCAEVGTKTETLTVTDVNGNSATCTSVVTIVDNIAPNAICQNVIVNLDAAGTATIIGSQVNNGSTDACGIATYDVLPNTFTCADLGSNSVVLTVTDVNGNASTCNANVTVVDNVAPTALCQNITIYLDGTGNASIVPADVNNGSSDACGIASISASPLAFNCTNIGANNVILTVDDVNGNSTNCTAIVTVLETTAPVAVCQDIPVSLNAAGSATILATDLNNGSSDNCAIASYNASQTSFDCADLGANVVVLTVTDGSGNSATCNSTVTVSDAIAPTANCQDISINLNAVGTVSITPNMINNGSFDNCTITATTASQTAFTCANVGANNVTLNLIDQSGNSSSCIAVVTVVDNIPPVALCQNVTANLDPTGNVSVSDAMVNNGSSDACGILSTVLSTTSFTCANVGPNTVTLTVTDVNSNVSTCTATVNVVDDLDPIMVCQNISVNLDAAGNATITAAMINNGTSDNCGIASLSASQTSFNCSNVGTNNIVLTAQDVNGNTNTCTSVVTIVDAVAPIAVCQNISVNLNASGNATITGALINNGSSDACGIASLVASPAVFTCANVGPNTVTLTVTDVNGNNSTCTSTVTVVDNIAPTALCQSYTANLDVAGTVTVTSANIDNASFDNCGIATMVVSPATFGCSNVGPNSVTMTVTDVNGLVSVCSATVTVVDNITPNALCQDLTVQLGATGQVLVLPSQVDNGSNDACNPIDLSFQVVNTIGFTGDFDPSNWIFNSNGGSGSASFSGSSSVTLVGTNSGFGTSTTLCTTIQESGVLSFNWNYSTVDGPNWDPFGYQLNSVFVVLTNAGGPTSQSGTVSIPVISGNQFCFSQNSVDGILGAGVTISDMLVFAPSGDQILFDCAEVGPNSIVLAVTDPSGNVGTCSSIITVEDNIAPTAICQNQTINLDATGNASVTAAQINNGSFDNCGIASVVVSPTAFTCANVGANTVTLTVTDVNSNVSTCTATVTVVDNLAPNAVCQNISANLDATGNATISAAMINNGSNDNCGIASAVASTTNFTCVNVGANNVTLTVTDVNGNVASCNSIVSVIDAVAPTAICQDLTINLNAAGSSTITASMINNGSSDACGVATLTASQTIFNCSHVGANTVTLTVMDVNTNTSTCSSTVTVVDNIAPIALCQNVTVNLDATGNATVTAIQVNNGSSDACGIASTDVLPNAFTCANVGPNTVTLTVTDVNGNTSTCTSTVNVIDNIAPIALCQAITVNLDATGNASITAASINSGSFDNCGIASTVASTTNFDCTDVGNNTVTLTVTDVNGNVAACNAVVTIVDVTAPVALCQDQTLTIDIFGNASTTVAALNNGSSDECGIASITASQTIFDCSDLGANNITLTVNDVNGNVSTCTSVVTLQDLIAPTIVTQDITVSLDATGFVTITGAMITAAAFDNCAITSIVLPTSTFDCTDIGPNNVTLIVSDASGNSATGTAVVTVVDNMAPNALCQNVSVNLNAAGSASITPAMINNGSTDNCGIASVTASPLNFTCANVGNNNVTLTVNDVNGNSASCLAVVTVIDNIAPIAVCQNVTLNLDSNGDALLTPAMVNNGSSDNCSIAFMGVSQANFTCANTGANTVTLTATDASGNTSTCTATVTILDNIAPNAVCENITINLDASGNATITAAMIDNASNDNCGVASLTASQTSFTCANVGNNNVTLTVVDPSGNTTTCTSVVTVVDNVAPAANCQNATVNLNAAGTASITAATINNGSFDACGIASTVASVTNFTCANVGPNTVTLTVTDVNGNSSTCTSTVTVVDAIAPAAVCQNVSVSLNPTGNAAITTGMINNGSADACGIATITASQTAFDCTDLGANNVTLTVTDVNGNVGTCVAIVTVIDGIAPVIACAPNVTVNNNPGICGATVTLVSPVATDNCTATITNNAPALFNVGTTTVLWTATDAAGNAVNCTQTVTVLDNEAPTITCPANLTVNTDPNICFATGVNLGSPVTADNCTVASVTNNSPSVYPVGTTTVIWTILDQAGNSTTCAQTVTVVDNQAPVVVCTSDIVLNTVEGSCGRVVNYAIPTVVDNCSVISMTQSDASGYTSGDIFPVGTTVISYTAVDGSGNTYTCSFNVTIVDNQNPVLVGCPSNMTVESGAGSCDVAVNWVSPSANDNCPGVDLTTTHTPGSLFGPGTTVVSYQAIDNSGNMTSCSFTVTVVDGNSPIVPELADVYNSCQVNTLPSPVADDICAGEIIGTTTTIFPITTVGVTPVIWTFNDGNGNISTATQYVYIDGDVDATVTIVNDVTLMANNSNATYQWIDCSTGNAIPGATNQTFVATANGEYAVIVTEGNCPAETSDCILVKNVGLTDITLDDLTIYPNPSVGGLFTINFSGKIDKVEILDMIGRVIAVEVNLENGSVNGTELASGKYYVRVYSEGTSIAKEVIVINK